MKAWKAILAALVIFAAGVVTGALTVRLKPADSVAVASPSGNFGPLRPRGDLLERMQRQLYLTPEQRGRIEGILRENHDRMKQIWDSIAPQAQAERRRVNELIRNELTPEQQKRYEDLQKPHGPKRNADENRRREERDRRDPAKTPGKL